MQREPSMNPTQPGLHPAPRTTRRSWLAGAAALAGSTWLPAARAQQQPVTLLVPWAAGGGTDMAARALARLLAPVLGQPVQVENRTGNSGVTGHQAMADAAPDGLTLGVATFEITTLATLGLTPLRYTEFAVLAPAFVNVPGVHVRSDSPHRSLADLLKAIAAAPGRLKASGSAQGSAWHLALAGLLADRGLPAQAVQWTSSAGSAPALKSLQAGEIDFTVNGIGESRALFDQGQVRTLAHMFQTPLIGPFISVPTVQQSLDSRFHMHSWGMVVAPKNLPPPVERRLVDALKQVYASPQYRSELAALGLFQLPYESPAKLREHLYADELRNARTLQALGLAQRPAAAAKRTAAR